MLTFPCPWLHAWIPELRLQPLNTHKVDITCVCGQKGSETFTVQQVGVGVMCMGGWPQVTVKDDRLLSAGSGQKHHAACLLVGALSATVT